MNEKELANTVGADTISFMTVEELQHAIGLPRQNLCMRCFEKGDVTR
jgi:glutamine phosphoribosylpyrophosphate amidotransferase